MIEILSLGLNNLSSIEQVFRDAGEDHVRILRSSGESIGEGLLVLPGTGNFGAGIRELRSRGFDDLVRNAIAQGRCIFGVCLGMQLMFESSAESAEVLGLSLVPGHIEKLSNQEERVPRVGWAEVRTSDQSSLFDEFNGKDVYFSHSYGVVSFNHLENTLVTNHGHGEILAGFVSNKLAGFQFHPERSSAAGLGLIRQIIKWSRNED